MAKRGGMKTRRGYLFKRGKYYHVRVMVNGEPVVQSTGETTKRAARQKQKEIVLPYTATHRKDVLENIAHRLDKASAEARVVEDARNPGITFSEAWAEYLRSPKRPDSGPATLRGYRIQWGRFIRWMKEHHSSSIRLKDVTPEHAEAFVTELRAARSANTVNKYIAFLTLMFKVLREPAKAKQNPFDGILRLRSIQNSRRELTIEELRRVCAAAEGGLRPLIAIGLYTGLRLGDAATLRWAEVDLERNLIRRIPNKTARRSPKPVIIPIHASLLAVLTEIDRSHDPEYVMPQLAQQYMTHNAYVTNRIQELFERCEIRTHKPGTGSELKKNTDGSITKSHTGKRAVVEVGFHSLRHSFVSLCRESGAPLAVVEAIVGHSNPAMTRHYTHLGEEAAAQAVCRLPSITSTPPKTAHPQLQEGPPVPPLPETCAQARDDKTSADKGLESFKAEISRIASGMNAQTWKTVQEKILSLCR